MGKENRKERDSFLSKFMYFHEWKNDTCKKYEKGKGDDVQILRDGSRLIPDEITKFIEAQGDIWGKFRGFETVLILRLHMYPCIIFPVFAFCILGKKLSNNPHRSNISTNCSRTFSILSRVIRKIENVTFWNVLGSIKIIPIYKNVL